MFSNKLGKYKRVRKITETGTIKTTIVPSKILILLKYFIIYLDDIFAAKTVLRW